MFAVWQSRSASLSDWYQTTETLPGSPATIQGQNTRPRGVWATTTGRDHVRPKSCETIILIELGAGPEPPSQPFLVPRRFGLSSQTMYASSLRSIASAGQW